MISANAPANTTITSPSSLSMQFQVTQAAVQTSSGFPRRDRKIMRTEQRIAGCRAKIDRLDAQLLALLNQRAQLARRLGHLKKKAKLPLSNQMREREVLVRLFGETVALSKIRPSAESFLVSFASVGDYRAPEPYKQR